MTQAQTQVRISNDAKAQVRAAMIAEALLQLSEIQLRVQRQLWDEILRRAAKERQA